MRLMLALLITLSAILPISGGASIAAASSTQNTSYTSRQFDYKVSWLPPWERAESSSKAGEYDRLRLSAGDSSYEYLGLAREFDGGSTDAEFEAAAQKFLRAVADERRRTHPELTVEQEWGIGGSHSAPMVLSYRDQDGSTMQEYLRLNPLFEQKAVLVTIFGTPSSSSPALRSELMARVSRGRSSWQGTPPDDVSVKTLLGSVRLRTAFDVAADGTCAGSGAFRDVAQGMRVVAANVVDVPLAEAYLGIGLPVPAQTGRGTDCLFYFSFWSLPEQPFYRFYVGDLIRQTVDQPTLEQDEWTIEFVF